MKVLFITKGNLPDYQADTIMHGGRSVLGSDFVDANYPWYMYKKEKEQFWNIRVPDNGRSYGRGMTLHGTLDECNVDRTDLVSKIRKKYFDFIIYGSASRCVDHLQEVMANYPKEKIAFVDGEDDQMIRREYLNMGIIFKRELTDLTIKGVFPISFGAPKEKIVKSIPTKTQDWGTVIPGDMSTYIFEDEKSYYDDYQKSYFSLTHKKGGWDCMRHYEILLNGCVPYFPDIQNCPTSTMVNFPKDLCSSANEMIKREELNLNKYFDLANNFLVYTRQKLTTECIFNSMLDKVYE
jgi:hypothetical protein